MSLEIFAVFNYKELAGKYPQFQKQLLEMAETELDHELYFKSDDMNKNLYTWTRALRAWNDQKEANMKSKPSL